MNKSSILPVDLASFEQPVSGNKERKNPSVIHINSLWLIRFGSQILECSIPTQKN